MRGFQLKRYDAEADVGGHLLNACRDTISALDRFTSQPAILLWDPRLAPKNLQTAWASCNWDKGVRP
jgi:hypothetical protein